MDELRIRDIGEQGLLQRLQPFCPPGLIGDDAALLSVAPGQSLVVTTDVLVDQVHFSDSTTSPHDIGWRAAAANLSDLAAMGATPLGITVGLALPGEVPVDWVEHLYGGLKDCLDRYDTPIVGGDICRSAIATISITALGQVDPAHAIRRSTAQPGDAILVTGVHGASRAGLELLLHPELGAELSEGDRHSLITAHQRPTPRLDILPLLGDRRQKAEGSNSTPHTLLRSQEPGVRSQESAGIPHLTPPHSYTPTPNTQHPTPRIAGMDSSDGLADALVQICRASNVGAHIDRHLIPMPAVFQSWLSPEKALEWALNGGEDFELVLCLAADFAETVVSQLGAGAALIGTITSDPEVVVHDASGQYPDQVLNLNQGFQHF
ncbi:MAG TPA: thiamine-phosphate kinase [Crinalium sp.]|jgi:thiamine-monophosphate kinase